METLGSFLGKRERKTWGPTGELKLDNFQGLFQSKTLYDSVIIKEHRKPRSQYYCKQFISKWSEFWTTHYITKFAMNCCFILKINQNNIFKSAGKLKQTVKCHTVSHYQFYNFLFPTYPFILLLFPFTLSSTVNALWTKNTFFLNTF